MAVKIRTVGDLEELYYGKGASYIQKADNPVLSTTPGVYNAVFGAKVWSQLNQEANIFGALPKFVWNTSGWRVKEARSVNNALGIGENGLLPDTTKPDYRELSTKPKSHVITFDVSEIQDFLAQSGDDAIGDMEFLRADMAAEFKEGTNIILLADNQTAAGDNFESVDRVVASNSEITNNGLAADSVDIYGIDRDAAASIFDAQVADNGGAAQTLNDAAIRGLQSDVRAAGGNSTFWFTGYDTNSAIQGIYQDQVRYNVLETQSVSFSVNGIETDNGITAGYTVSTLYSLPLIQSKDTASDTISRLYLLDSSDPTGLGDPRLGVKVAKPTQYFEAGMAQGSPFAIDRLGNEGMYRMMGELICHHFAAQGKLRNLQ